MIIMAGRQSVGNSAGHSYGRDSRQAQEELRSHCSRNPDFAHPVLMIIRNCSLILGTYSCRPGAGRAAWTRQPGGSAETG